jgi:hypothetical protein
MHIAREDDPALIESQPHHLTVILAVEKDGIEAQHAQPARQLAHVLVGNKAGSIHDSLNIAGLMNNERHRYNHSCLLSPFSEAAPNYY